MRLWSLHPSYLDVKGLVALWREALLAKAVLKGETRGYRHHPQLDRFRSSSDPLAAINAYLASVLAEAEVRGYSFDKRKVNSRRKTAPIPVTRGQLAFERHHLMEKLAARDPERGEALRDSGPTRPHPLFRAVPGGIEDWERGGS